MKEVSYYRCLSGSGFGEDTYLIYKEKVRKGRPLPKDLYWLPSFSLYNFINSNG